MGKVGLGMFLGIGLAVYRSAYRPALKGAIKLAMVTSEAVKKAAHEGEEVFADLVAEARQELAESRAAAAPDEAWSATSTIN